MEKWIWLKGLHLDVSIGVHDFEKYGPQPYKLTIGLCLEAEYKTVRDAIEETVNYDALRTGVSNHLLSQQFNLQETVIQDVIGICFDIDPRITGVDVQTEKTSVYPNCDSVGLRYKVTRSEWQHKLLK